MRGRCCVKKLFISLIHSFQILHFYFNFYMNYTHYLYYQSLYDYASILMILHSYFMTDAKVNHYSGSALFPPFQYSHLQNHCLETRILRFLHLSRKYDDLGVLKCQ